MIRHVLAVLTLALLALVGGHAAHGQAIGTPTPTPVSGPVTPTTTPVPSGHALIELMRKVMLARRTVRVNEIERSTWTGHSVLGWTWLDMDLRSSAVREVDSWQRVRPNAPSITISLERRALLLAHGVAASREPGRAWYCEHLRGVRARNLLIPFQMTDTTVTNLGAATASGVPVWHVRATDAEVPAWSTNNARVDLYIAQRDNSLVRLDLIAAPQLGGHTTHEAVTQSYSHYGIPIAVTLPQRCR